MSRSYKKPYSTEGYGGDSRKYMKHQATKKLRNYNFPLIGNEYKKLFESWMICDYKMFYKKHEKYHEKMKRK